MMKFEAKNKVYGKDFQEVGETRVETMVMGEDIYAVMDCFREFLQKTGWVDEVIDRGFCYIAGVEGPENSVVKTIQKTWEMD